MDKHCSRCKIEKTIEHFSKCKTSKDGYHPHCKDCKKLYRMQTQTEYNKKYYQKNKDKILESNKAYREAHQEEISEQRREYRKVHKEHIKEKYKEYLPVRKAKIKERRKEDNTFRLSEILRGKIHKMIDGKETSYMSLIGCDIDTLKHWLEFQFDENMTWENLGSYWQIDHILPISKFDLNDTNQQRICFSWTNLQPLHKTENRQKSNRIELHYYFNSIITMHRFIQYKNGPSSGYQNKYESICWLRKNSGMVKTPWITNGKSAAKFQHPL